MHQQWKQMGWLVAACILAVAGQKSQAGVGTDPVIVPFALPAVTISDPASETCSVSDSHATVTVIGTSQQAVGQLAWTNRLTAVGGSLDASENWSVPEVALSEGVNEITVTATNAAGVAAAATVKVIRQAPPAVGALRIGVFSDPHYFAPELLLADGPAFETYLAQDRKLIAESAAITKAVVDQLIARNPSVVFVTGDLTKDGERDSHIAFAKELARLEAAGAQVLVIPGNHDIDNPHAVSYDGAAALPVPSVSPADFKSIYGPFGYDLASATDPDSVGYTVPLTPALTVVCMDSTQYGNRTHGAFTNGARLAWITNQLVTARAAGAQAIGLMHHGLLEHFPGQKQLFSEYVLDGYETVAPLFASLGLKAVFTGHFHANDIAQAEFDGHTLTDIETGSTVTYPCPFRVLEIADDGTVSITTDTVTAIDYDLGSAPDFPSYASDYLWEGMLLLSSYMLQMPPFGLAPATAEYLAPAVTEALLAHYEGDEPGLAGATPQTQAIVSGLLGGDPSSRQLGGAIYSILTDTQPDDNHPTLDLDLSPAVSLTAPAHDAVCVLSQAVTLRASASDDGRVTNVCFLVGGVEVSSVSEEPYEATWTPLASGRHTLTARATDNAGQTTQSAEVSVLVPALTITSPADGATVGASADALLLSISADLAGLVTFANTTLGTCIAVPAGVGSASLPLAYGLNVLAVSGTNRSGQAFSSTVTVTRAAPEPANGDNLLPGWDASADGTVHVAWTTNDWYQFQASDVCLPGAFLFRDGLGGAEAPGDGEPEATTSGATHVRYDAADGTRSIVVEGDADFSVRIPCFDSPALGAPRTHEVWARVSYWDAPGNPAWVQGWTLSVTPDSGSATAPVLVGRVHGADGVITEAYACTVTGDPSDLIIRFSADPALSALNPAYVSSVTVDTRFATPLRISGPAEGGTVSSATESATVAVESDGLVGTLLFRNENTGETIVVPVNRARATLDLIYGANVISVTGTDSEGRAVTANVTVTRAAPAPSNGEAVLPDWDYTAATGAVHVAWTTDDWYTFQSGDTCQPGTFLFRDPFGGEIAPGAGDPDAVTWWGATHFRYDAQDGSRCVVVEEDDDLSFWVPCYGSAVTGVAPIFQSAWIQLTYWDAPGNPEWVQNWVLTPYAIGAGASATAPELVGRSRGADGLITEAYRLTISGDAAGLFVDVAADPELSALNPAYISAVTIDTCAPTQPLIDSPAEGTTVDASSDSVTLTFRSQVFAGTVTCVNAALSGQVSGVASAGSLAVPLAYGLNVLTLSGTNVAGHAISTTVTVTREAPMPAQGTNLLPGWDAASGAGTAQAVWTTNDWYQFQSGDTCLPGLFLYRDPFGGTEEPGDGEPVAATSGSAHFRYDAADGTRCVVVASDTDFSMRMPCYDMPALGAPRTHDVWVRVSYWDAPGNPGWVQGWVLSVTPDSGTATTPALMGRVHGTDGLITEAYAFTVTGDTSAFGLGLAAEPSLSALNHAYVSEVAVATRTTTPLLISGPADGSTVSSATECLTVDVTTNGMVGALTVRNQTTGAAHTVQASAGSLQVGLVFGLNVITVTGTDDQGRTVTATVTVTRQAPTPLGGTAVEPDWDSAVASGTAHAAWTTNDWYQFQSGDTCLPGAFLFRDPFGGATEPGDGGPVALSSGATHFRYDAADGARCVAVEEDAALSVRMPLYDMPALGAPRTHEVWVRVSYWDAPGNPEWVQSWSLGVTPDSGNATAPELRGRAHGADGVITEAYAFTVTGDASAFALSFSADPALSALNAAYVSEVTVDTRVAAPLLIASPAEGDTVASSMEYATVAAAADGLVGLLTYRNETTGQVLTADASRGRAMIALAYGLNVITVTGADSQGRPVSATVTITREAPPPANGAAVVPDWDYAVATGAVHVAWTTNDWYQFQSGDTCLPGTFLYRDPFGGSREPGAAAPDALTQGATHFRYDAQDGTRCAVVEQNWDLSLWVPCYGSSVAGVPMNQRVWVRVSYWDAPGNPQWVQDWDIAPYAPGASVSTPVLMGRTHGADGLITEAYAFTVTGDAPGFFVDVAAAPALSALNPAYVSDVRVDVVAEPGVLAHRILTTVEGNGTVSAGNILVAHGASTNIVLAAAEWHRIHTLTTNGAEVVAAAGASCYTQHWASVTADHNNQVVFGLRADEQNPGGVPTVWLASFGRGESAPVAPDGLSLSDKHLLDLDPYSQATVAFDIEHIEVKAGGVEIRVRLLVDGERQPAINGALVIEGRPTLADEWAEVDSTPLTGDVFDDAGCHLYTVPAGANRFFRARVR